MSRALIIYMHYPLQFRKLNILPNTSSPKFRNAENVSPQIEDLRLSTRLNFYSHQN